MPAFSDQVRVFSADVFWPTGVSAFTGIIPSDIRITSIVDSVVLPSQVKDLADTR
jgi:hypothetical protein